jgi:hypothetical protein
MSSLLNDFIACLIALNCRSKAIKNIKMKQKQQILGALTIAILIIIGLRFAGYRDYIPSPLLWALVAVQLGISYLWKPQTP